MKILFLNGPPGSGKDYAGRAICSMHQQARTVKFARILKERTHGLYGISSGPGGPPAAHDWFESRKDEPAPEFLGLTPREAYIAVSEDYMKPKHGQAVFGDLLVNELETPAYNDCTVAVITDSGFFPEAERVVHRFTPEKCMMLQINRPGCSFDGDSRGFVDLSPLCVPTQTVWNNGTTDFIEDLIVTLDGFMPRESQTRLPRYL